MTQHSDDGARVATGEVTWWKDDEGHGAVATSLGPIEVVFATIEGMSGFRSLRAGEVVTMEIGMFDEGSANTVAPGFVGWATRTVRGTTLGPPPTEPPVTEGSACHISILEITHDEPDAR